MHTSDESSDPRNYVSIIRRGTAIRLTRRFCEVNDISNGMGAILGWLDRKNTPIRMQFVYPSETLKYDKEPLHRSKLHRDGHLPSSGYNGLAISAAGFLRRIARYHHLERSALVGRYSYEKVLSDSSLHGAYYVVDLTDALLRDLRRRLSS